MKMGKKVLAATIVMCSALALAPMSAAFADTYSPSTMPPIGGGPTGTDPGTGSGSGGGTTTTNDGLTQDTINAVDPYISIVNGQYVLNDESTVAGLISADQLQDVQESLTDMNSRLPVLASDGYQPIDATSFSMTVTDSEADSEVIAAGYGNLVQQADTIDASVDPATIKNGVTKIVYHWWGYQIYLSRHLVEFVAGASVSTAAGALSAVLKGMARGAILGLATYIVAAFVPWASRAIIVDVSWNGYILWYQLQ